MAWISWREIRVNPPAHSANCVKVQISAEGGLTTSVSNPVSRNVCAAWTRVEDSGDSTPRTFINLEFFIRLLEIHFVAHKGCIGLPLYPNPKHFYIGKHVWATMGMCVCLGCMYGCTNRYMINMIDYRVGTVMREQTERPSVRRPTNHL